VTENNIKVLSNSIEAYLKEGQTVWIISRNKSTSLKLFEPYSQKLTKEFAHNLNVIRLYYGIKNDEY
jgi:hypothetical protein